jgi:hypothetical protein
MAASSGPVSTVGSERPHHVRCSFRTAGNGHYRKQQQKRRLVRNGRENWHFYMSCTVGGRKDPVHPEFSRESKFPGRNGRAFPRYLGKPENFRIPRVTDITATHRLLHCTRSATSFAQAPCGARTEVALSVYVCSRPGICMNSIVRCQSSMPRATSERPGRRFVSCCTLARRPVYV